MFYFLHMYLFSWVSFYHFQVTSIENINQAKIKQHTALFWLWTDFTCWNVVFYWSRNDIIQYVNYYTLQTKNIKNRLHLVPTKFYQWNECFAKLLWSLASLWDHFVLKGCKSHYSRTTLTLKWLFYLFIHKIWLVQDIISNMVVVFMSLFMVLFIFCYFLVQTLICI